jgi:hypothetical protein
MRAVAIWALLAGCGMSSFDGASAPDAGGSGGVPPETCGVSLMSTPTTAIAGSTIRVVSHVFNAPGILGYQWSARFNDAAADPIPVTGDPSQVDLRSASPGVFDVTLDITGALSPCPTATLPINVMASGARSSLVRLRITPPQLAEAPPYEKVIQINGGGNFDLGTVAIDQGVRADVVVRGPGGAGVPAYLRFAPTGTPDAVVEAFSDATGHATARIVAGTHSVVVVPQVGTSAPRRIDGWSSASSTIDLDAGVAVTGMVRDPAGAVLPGAKLQLAVAGLPSLVATTDLDGSFALRAAGGGGPVTIEVTPPNASGLPRLLATSAALDLGVPLQIRYAANVTLVNLAGTVVRRQSVPVAGAGVTVVGSLAAVGTVTAGAVASATGDVRIKATTDGSGALPEMLVPVAASPALSAVVAVAAGDFAVAALDTSTGVPASLDAPPLQPIVTAVFLVPDRLPGAVVDIVPIGALALVGAPPFHLIADGSGAVTAALAAGGHYQLRFHDPLGRGAQFVVADATAKTIAPSHSLAYALEVRGTVKLGGTQPLGGASIQLLCNSCTGIERAKPIDEVASDDAGRFRIPVADPGVSIR